MTAAAGFDVMCAFYADERAEGCDPEAGGDKLTIRWATTEWYLFPRAERTDLRLFRIVLEREMVTAAADDISLALSIVLLFEPSADLVRLGSGNWSGGTPGQLGEFRHVVRESGVFNAIGRERPSAVRMLIGWADRTEPGTADGTIKEEAGGN
jgi:hypothetical protein